MKIDEFTLTLEFKEKDQAKHIARLLWELVKLYEAMPPYKKYTPESALTDFMIECTRISNDLTTHPEVMDEIH